MVPGESDSRRPSESVKVSEAPRAEGKGVWKSKLAQDTQSMLRRKSEHPIQVHCRVWQLRTVVAKSPALLSATVLKNKTKFFYALDV